MTREQGSEIGTQRAAVGYVRVSTGRQAESGLSLEDQRDRIRAYCKARGYSLLAIFSDEGVSGTSMKGRSGLREALETVCEASGVLVAYDLSRVGRSLRDCVAVSETLTAKGADLALLDMNADTSTATGRLLFHVIAAVGEMQAAQTGEKTRAALAKAKARGVKLGKPRKLTPWQETQIRARSKGGETNAALAKEFDVHPNTIYKILRRSNHTAKTH